jgi:hypothetical protein
LSQTFHFLGNGADCCIKTDHVSLDNSRFTVENDLDYSIADYLPIMKEYFVVGLFLRVTDNWGGIVFNG